METTEFDATVGGTEHLPYSANSLRFAVSRSVEIAAMTESIFRPSKTKLIFQTLPVHMRRRVMSHNCKRLPRKLREGHLEQMKKSGLPPKQKRPSRKYRRRPTNLLDEYNRRQKQNVWLETHIWHAKRFHMVDRWGHKIAYRPCDKAFRACYRATSKHCLMQDISYNTPIQIKGPLDHIKNMFKSVTNSACGLSIGAKAFTNGFREGDIHLYQQNMYPFGYIGKISFIWICDKSEDDVLLLNVHPSILNAVETLLKDLTCDFANDDEYLTAQKKRKTSSSSSEKIKMKVLPHTFNRFQLTGPNSHAILVQSLKCIDKIEKIKDNEWIKNLRDKTGLYLNEKSEYWQSLNTLNCPSQLPPRIVIGLIVKDPRLSRPKKRTKAKQEICQSINIESLTNTLPSTSQSPIWDADIHEVIKKNRMTNNQYIQYVTKTQLVPGEVNEDDPALQSVPVVLIQKPGSQDANVKRLGYGSGYDIIVPSGYGLPFWQTFVMFGARTGGLRETESLAFESSQCYFPPDSSAGKIEQKRIEENMKIKYFRLPPSKRVNYNKLAINSPFTCPWELLLKDWSYETQNNFFVLRNKKLITEMQICLQKKNKLPDIENANSCLVAVHVKLCGKGSIKSHALICLPQDNDNSNTLYELQHRDPNEKLRKQKRLEHKKWLKQQRRKRMKLRRKSVNIKSSKKGKKYHHEPSEYVKTMRKLWVPSQIESVRKSCIRDVMGYVTQGTFSYTEAKTCGVGYIAFTALATLIKSGQNKILVRNTTSRTYRLADVLIINTC